MVSLMLNSALSGCGVLKCPVWLHGCAFQPAGVLFVAASLTPEPDQNQPLTLRGRRSRRVSQPLKLQRRPLVQTYGTLAIVGAGRRGITNSYLQHLQESTTATNKMNPATTTTDK